MKNRNKTVIKHMMLIAVIFSLLASCTYDQVAPIDAPDDVSFSTDIMPIFDTSCNVVGCHSANTIPPDLTQSQAWDDLIARGLIDTQTPKSSTLWAKIDTGGSMEQYATNNDRVLILAWIEQGALDN